MTMNRRRFLSLLAVPSVAALYTWRIEPTWVEYVRRVLPLPGLPAEWVGKTLVQLSDIHIGDQVDRDYLAGVFRSVARMRPDIVAYTGDFISYRGAETLAQFATLAPLLPRGRLGTLAVLGNHDYGSNWREYAVADAVAAILTANGCMVLRNSVAEVGGLMVGGVEDLWSGRLRLASCLAGPRLPLMLCHNPDACDLPGWSGFEGWVLAGHTHGGQCRPPFLPPPLLPVKNRRYTAGEVALGWKRSLYINRGLGHLLRVRFNVRPEVTIFELVRA
jgi:uncharacterized protein